MAETHGHPASGVNPNIANLADELDRLAALYAQPVEGVAPEHGKGRRYGYSHAAQLVRSRLIGDDAPAATVRLS